MPAEVEETTSHVQSNGFPAKAGGNSFSTDFPLLPSNGKRKAGKEIGTKLNGILAAEEHMSPQEHSSTTDEAPITAEVQAQAEAQDGTSSMCDDEGARESSDHDCEVKVEETEMVIEPENGDLHIGGSAGEPAEISNGDTGQKEAEEVARNVNAEWIPADVANSGWEVADDQSVLGPGPMATEESKTAELKPAAAKELYTFYMIRVPKLADNKSRTEIKMADQLFKDKTEKRDSFNTGFKLKRTNRQEALEKVKAARERVWVCVDAIRSKRGEIEPLQTALKKIKEAGKLAREKSRDLPASEQELDERIAYFEYRIQHESIPLREEKQLLRDIKNLKSRREEVCANEALHADFAESLGERDDIHERLKVLNAELDVLRADCDQASEKLKIAEAGLEKMDEALHKAQSQYTVANQARQDAYEARAVLHKESNARNDEFYKTRWEIQNVRQMAFKKDKKAVEETCHAQVERLMTLWNYNDEFRAAYVKANEKSTLKRLQTFDGRALGPGEEPPVIPVDHDDVDTVTEVPVAIPAVSHKEREAKVKPAEPSHVPVQSSVDFQRKDPDMPSSLVVERDDQSSKKTAASQDAASISEQDRMKEEAALAAELKEKRRQQEMAKAKEAEERKKRSAERAQSKALARAQKEAERREKEKEKKARKKAASLAASSQSSEIALEAGGEVLPEVEPESKTNVKDFPSESKPSPRQRRKPGPQKSRTVVKTPVPLSSKKDGIHQKTWFWIVVGLIIFLGILGLLVRFLL